MNKNQYNILSSKEYNQRVKKFYPNQIPMLFRTPKGNDRNYGYVLCKNLFTNGIVYPHSAHWFKRKKDAEKYCWKEVSNE
tara:strand:+ start:724 stop:963 length:240 start_codon:yes stop_codon:yes gene_type:complete